MVSILHVDLIDQLLVFLKYSVCLKFLVQLLISGVVNGIVKNVLQTKRRPRVEDVHGLQGKWIGNWHVKNY